MNEAAGNYRARRFHAHKVGADRLMAAYGPSLPLATRQLLEVDRTSVLLSSGRRLSVLLDPRASAGWGAGGGEDCSLKQIAGDI